jgi:hypothetical protein
MRGRAGQIARFAGQGVLYLLFALLLGSFSTSPAYVHFDPDQALIKLSLSHAGARKGECRERKTSANIPRTETSRRALLECPRERFPVWVEVVVDGELRYGEERPPTGLSNDGASRFYHRIPVAAGVHRIVARMRDSGRKQGFDRTAETEVSLVPRQVFVIDFSSETKSFLFK